jgi:hypothetical protein
MTKRYSISDLIIGHFDSFRGKSNSFVKNLGFWLFILIPVASGLILSKNPLKDAGISLIAASLSILAGLLFTLLASLFTLVEKYSDDSNKYDNSKDLFTSIYNNIGFGILIAVFCISLTLAIGSLEFKNTFLFDILIFFNLDTKSFQNTLSIVARFLVYSSCIMFLMTLLMILRKMQNLFMRMGFITPSQKKKYPN